MKIIGNALASAFWLAVGVAVVAALAVVRMCEWLAQEPAA